MKKPKKPAEPAKAPTKTTLQRKAKATAPKKKAGADAPKKPTGTYVKAVDAAEAAADATKAMGLEEWTALIGITFRNVYEGAT